MGSWLDSLVGPPVVKIDGTEFTQRKYLNLVGDGAELSATDNPLTNTIEVSIAPRTELYSVVRAGAVGDGTADDTAAFIAAIQYVGEHPDFCGVVVPTGTYKIDCSLSATIDAIAHAYAIEVPSNTKIVLEDGAKMILANEANGHLFLLQSVTNVKISGGELDGNRANQTGRTAGQAEHSLIYCRDCNNVRVENVVFSAVQEYATRILDCDYVFLDKLWCKDSHGSAFSIGTPLLPVNKSIIGDIIAENCEGDEYLAIGNSVIHSGDYCSFGAIHGHDNAAGFKLQGSSYCTVGRVVAENCGVTFVGIGGGKPFKIQGESGYPCHHIAVGEVVTYGSASSGGCYLDGVTESHDVNIGSIISENDGIGANISAVWIGNCARVTVGSVRVINSGYVGFTVREDAVDVQVGTLDVTNSGQVSGASANIDLIGNGIQIGQLRTETTGSTVTRGVNVNIAARDVSIGGYAAKGTFTHGTFWDGTSNAQGSSSVTIADGAIVDGDAYAILQSSATPNIRNEPRNLFRTANGVARSITHIHGGRRGRRIRIIIKDANTTFAFSTATNLYGNGGADWAAPIYSVLDAFFDDSVGPVTSSGTAPPVVGASGIPVLSDTSWRVEITTGGTLANAILRYSSDAGSTWTSNVTSAASVELGDTGVTLTMAAGTYAVDNVYTFQGGTWHCIPGPA